MRVLSFNSQATSAVQGRKGNRMRLDTRDGALFMRPTDRKAGPHVLTELESNNDTVKIQVSAKQLEKLAVGGLLTSDATFGLVADKYGWFSLVAAGGENAIEGAEITVAEQTEATVEVPAEA